MTQDLFALPPEEFTAARDELARSLRAAGEADEAKRVRGLRRPTVPAWAVNQLARQHPQELEELLETGAQLRLAQRRALSGSKGAGLRDATRTRRDHLDQLTELAADLLASSGRNPDPHRSAVAATLEAASIDEEAAEAVRAGTLSKELPPPSGFGDLSPLSVVPDIEEEQGEEPDEEARQRAEAEERLRQARERVEEVVTAAREAEQEARDAREEADEAAEAVEQLERRLSRARKRARETETAATRARRVADDRAAQAKEAQEELERTKV
jgi:hypothetical protein